MLTLAQQYALDDCLHQQNLLTNEDLIVELTDHFTLSLDQQMSDGVSFEKALANVVADFGGRKELQQMERRYNRITFRQYTAVWTQAVLGQFKGYRLWITLTFYGFAFYVNADAPAPGKPTHFITGISLVLLTGLVLTCLFTKANSRYFFSLFQLGYHNPPTEMQYVFTRVLGVALLLMGLGEIGIRLTADYPLLLHPAIIAAYYTSTVIYINSYSLLNRHLYNIEPSIWNG